MRGSKNAALLIAFYCVVSSVLSGCSSLIESAVADSTETGFTPSNSFPERNKSQDQNLPQIDPVSEEKFNHFATDIALPQSRGALVGLLGWPISEDGNFSYWKLTGGSELAIYFTEDTALWYTVGQY